MKWMLCSLAVTVALAGPASAQTMLDPYRTQERFQRDQMEQSLRRLEQDAQERRSRERQQDQQRWIQDWAERMRPQQAPDPWRRR
jgi:hypothetical protein